MWIQAGIGTESVVELSCHKPVVAESSFASTLLHCPETIGQTVIVGTFSIATGSVQSTKVVLEPKKMREIRKSDNSILRSFPSVGSHYLDGVP